ncbi:Zinc transporter 1 [Lamellibrachia satsuma]|nr:Zinc transporter 1 [Lamellibrachia satsuma]
MVVIIMITTIPLLKASALVLLQTVPLHIQVRKLQERLLLEVPGVNAVHEFHIWQLAGNRIIASAHILCRNQADYMRIASDVKRFFHNEGIHSTTIQPEFVENVPLPEGMYCVFDCPDQLCDKNTCCGSMKQQLFFHDVNPNHTEIDASRAENIPGSVPSN